MSWTAETSTPWLSLSKSSGSTLPDSVIVTASVGGRQPISAIETGMITVRAADGSTVEIRVQLTIGSFSNRVNLPFITAGFTATAGW